MHVEIDQDRCCGSGLCVQTAPAIFDQRDADGIGFVIQAEPQDEESRELARDAAAMCPAAAVLVTE